MISLYKLLKEHEGEEHKPYMFSPVGFSCAVCEYYYIEDGKHMCKSQEYAEYMGTNELVDEEGEQIQDPTKWCSNWFEPKQEEERLDEACWDGYRQVGLKKKGNRMVPNCVRIKEDKKEPKIKKAYLTKDASAMKKEIDRVKKLKDSDPSAYGKWEADYADKGKTKKYKTKKSVATSAYEKRFGKKEK